MDTTTKTTTTDALDALNTTPTTSTDLVTVEKKALDALNKSAQRGDLDDFLRGGRRSLLLVDTSASMGYGMQSGKRRIDALREVVRDLRKQHPVPVAAFGTFHLPEGVRTVCVVNDIPEPCGQTPLGDAIRFGTQQGATHLVVVTDGEPNDEQDAFDAAAAFGHPIDVIFIGDATDYGARFARELARRTGGSSDVTDLGEPKKLAGKIIGLLGDGN